MKSTRIFKNMKETGKPKLKKQQAPYFKLIIQRQSSKLKNKTKVKQHVFKVISPTKITNIYRRGDDIHH